MYGRNYKTKTYNIFELLFFLMIKSIFLVLNYLKKIKLINKFNTKYHLI